MVDVPPLSQRIDDMLAYLRTRRLEDDRSLLDVMSPERAADALKADRGTAGKQLERYFHRFAAGGR